MNYFKNLNYDHLQTILSRCGIEFNPLHVQLANDKTHSLLSSAPKLQDCFCKECKIQCETKYHRESLDCHLLAVGIIALTYAQEFYKNQMKLSQFLTIDDFTYICMIAGLFHDIGKCCAKVQGKKYACYVGHSQLGTRILEQLGNFKFKNEVLWAVNHHMCCCTHMNPISDNLPHISPFMTMDLHDSCMMVDVAFSILSVLSYADHFGRLSDDLDVYHNTIDTSHHSNNLFDELSKRYYNNQDLGAQMTFHNSKLILIMYGVSGSGKSFMANIAKERFSNELDIVHIERDASLYTVYRNFIGPTDNTPYTEIYAAIQANSLLRKEHQTQWLHDLVNGLTKKSSKNQLILIDSMQPLFSDNWSNIVQSIGEVSEEALIWYHESVKIGYYCIPMHMFGSEYTFESKIGMHMSLPNPDFRGMAWPSILTENYPSSRMDITYGSGSIQLTCNYIDNYIRIRKQRIFNDIEMKQYPLHVILNQIAVETYSNTSQETQLDENENILITRVNHICDMFISNFNNHYLNTRGISNMNHFIKYKIEMQTITIALIVFSYQDGFQVYDGLTRDYRGEGVIYDISTNMFSLVRPNMPVFPEMTQVYKDIFVQPYLGDIWDNIDMYHSMLYRNIQDILPHKKISTLYMAPKYDGSMFNVTHISNKHNTSELMSQLLVSDMQSSCYQNEYGMFMFGSKSSVFAGSLVMERIIRAIEATYSSIELFLSSITSYIYENNNFNVLDEIFTLHFEAIDAIPTSELTVYYGYAWCPFLGVTIYNQINDKKSFHMPIDQFYTSHLKCIANVYDCKGSWGEVSKIYESNFLKLLDGDEVVEPEGYVLLLIAENGDQFMLKYKYKCYYAAHKPESEYNINLVDEMTRDEKYKKLCQRFFKLRNRLTHDELINMIDATVLLTLVQNSCYQFGGYISRKDWALYWQSHTPELMVPLQDMRSVMVNADPFQKICSSINDKAVFSCLMNSYHDLLPNGNSAMLLSIPANEFARLLKPIFFN